MKTLLLTLSLTLSCFGQVTVTLPNLTVSAEAVIALNAWLPTQLSGVNATMTSSMLIGDTTVNVVSTAGISTQSAILLPTGEVAQVTAKTATTFTVVRAIYGTVAAAQPNSSLNPGVVRELKYMPTGAAGFNNLFRQLLSNAVAEIMQTSGTPTINTQKLAIINANTAINAATSGGIQ